MRRADEIAAHPIELHPHRGIPHGRELCGIPRWISDQPQRRESAAKRVVEVLRAQTEAARQGTHQRLGYLLHGPVVGSNSVAPTRQVALIRQWTRLPQRVSGHRDGRSVYQVAPYVDTLFGSQVSRLQRKPAAIDVGVARRELAPIQAAPPRLVEP